MIDPQRFVPTHTSEPHALRRRELSSRHPEIRSANGEARTASLAIALFLGVVAFAALAQAQAPRTETVSAVAASSSHEPALASAQQLPRPSVGPDGRDSRRLELLGAAGFLASPGTNGAAVMLGARVAVTRYVALELDVGYGVTAEAASDQLQDRWWLIPSVALVLPIGPVRLDIGVGIGVGATSGLGNLDRFERGVFDPVWAYQLTPTIRGHLVASFAIAPGCDAFARLDVASLLLDGNVGLRAGSLSTSAMDTTWVALSIGTSFRAL